MKAKLRVMPIMLIAVGVFLLLKNLNLLPEHFVGTWWPLLLIVAGVLGLLRSDSERSNKQDSSQA